MVGLPDSGLTTTGFNLRTLHFHRRGRSCHSIAAQIDFSIVNCFPSSRQLVRTSNLVGTGGKAVVVPWGHLGCVGSSSVANSDGRCRLIFDIWCSCWWSGVAIGVRVSLFFVNLSSSLQLALWDRQSLRALEQSGRREVLTEMRSLSTMTQNEFAS